MNKVLIITYYWPPTGGSGVQRWLKFVKYLREFGWEPVIYTPENPEAPVIDNSLLKDIPENIEVIKQPVWEPYSLYKKLLGKKKDEKINTGFLNETGKPSLPEKLSIWIRGNFFIPDARCFWIKPSIKFLTAYLRKHPVDVVVSTGPPHSMHMIGLGLKRKLEVKWVADFRDPWTNIDFYDELMLTSYADKKHRRMEMQVLSGADKVITIGKTMKDEFDKQMKEAGVYKNNKVEVITNGYDEEDVYKGEVVLDKKFSIAHIGTLTPSRNPAVLWNALSELVKENQAFSNDLEIKLIGKVDYGVMQSIKNAGLTTYVNKIDYLPHAEVLKLQQQSQVLLLLINNTKNSKGILTGKFFEYLAAQRPILCIGPEDGDAAEILNETKAGRVVGYNNKKLLKEVIAEFHKAYNVQNLVINSQNIKKYSRRELTRAINTCLKKV